MHIPKSVLFPVILLICCYGSFSINNSMFDVLVMGLLGVMGYVLAVFKFPEAPLLVAFVLGPLFEDNLRRSLILSHGSPGIFFSSPICWIFFVLTLLSLGYTAYIILKKRPAVPVD